MTRTHMLATLSTEIPRGEGWAFEPKYDGIRVLAYVADEHVRLMTRNGNEKSKQFPEVVEALRALARRRRRPFVLDGEIVASRGGALARFQALQCRIAEREAKTIARRAREAPAVLVAFDVVLDGDDGLTGQTWMVRRKRLERLLGRKLEPGLRLGDAQIGDGAQLLERARREGWEGVVAKHVNSRYALGKRSRDWLKVKVEARQEFVVGGWTEPRSSREHIGALLLGYYEGDRFVYAGHAGGGFTRKGLADMNARLAPLERATCPFETEPTTNEPAHWVTPRVVVEVKFSEWTSDGRLRQPTFLGVRDDKDPHLVIREPMRVRKMA
ncbi:MAG TPA: non-homologous end-joining DNA ligase [Gemmatimonadaceae bacterium]|nr:non-homologous end-joining DNA ligase [Gemmatimonadaceae bacterium]